MPITRFIAGDPSGDGATDLTIGAALDPEQSLSSGTTTATVEWPDATGGTAPYTYAISVKDEAGSAVTPNSGSGKGPYVIPVAAGKSYQATIGVTDADGQVARRAALVHVAAASPTVALQWETLFDGTFADTTSDGTISTNTTATLVGGDFDGMTYTVLRYNSNTGNVVIADAGVTVTGVGASGSTQFMVDISEYLPESPYIPTAVHFIVDSLDVTGSTKPVIIGISSDDNMSVAAVDGMRGNYVSSGNWSRLSYRDGSTIGSGTTETLPTQGVLTCILVGGVEVRWIWTGGTTTPPSSASLTAFDGATTTGASYTAAAARRYTTALWAGIAGIQTGSLRLLGVKVEQLTAGVV